MEKEGFRSEEEAKETGWLEVNAAGEKEADQPSRATDLRPPDADADALPAHHVLAVHRPPRAPHTPRRPWRRRLFGRPPTNSSGTNSGRPPALPSPRPTISTFASLSLPGSGRPACYHSAPSPGTTPSPIVAGDGLLGARSSPCPASTSLSNRFWAAESEGSKK